MATPINTIKTWFITGAKPTQSQFWAWIDSFRHKDEKVPVADVEGLNAVLSPFNSHLNDSNAHSDLFAKAKIYASGEFIVKKANDNTNNSQLEPGDLCEGIVSGYDIKGVFLGGDKTQLESFIIMSQDEIPTLPVEP